MTNPSEPSNPDQPPSLSKQPFGSPPEQQPSGTGSQPLSPPPEQQAYGSPGPSYGPPPGQQSYGSPSPSSGPPSEQYGNPGGEQPYGSFPQAPPPPSAPQVGAGGYVLDNASGLYLPPGVELASVGRRIGAYFLAIPLFIITLGIGYVIWGLMLWNRGTTPALKVLGMKVYRIDNGTVPQFWRMALREVVGRICDGILSFITELVSFIMFAAGAKRQTLHDLVASTTVVYDPNKVLGD